MTDRLKKLIKKKLVLCEGKHDSEFFEHLIKLLGVNDLQVASMDYATGSGQGGVSLITQALDAIAAVPGFAILEDVLIVVDNDDDPAAAFAATVRSIQSTTEILGSPNRRYAVPTHPMTKVGSNPTICVLMVPSPGTPGNLDVLCYQAAANAAGSIGVCVDAFASCTKADLWPIGKLAKMKLRSLISASWKKNPYISPSYVWSEGTNLVPLGDPVFADISAFLRNF